MPLDKNLLKNEILSIARNKPLSKQEVAEAWSNAYFNYAKGAIAGVTFPTLLNKKLIETQIITNFNFFVGFDLGIISFWKTEVWTNNPVTFTGSTVLATGFAASLISAGQLIINNTSDDFAAEKLSNTLDIVTKTVSVLITNVATGATSTVFLS